MIIESVSRGYHTKKLLPIATKVFGCLYFTSPIRSSGANTFWHVQLETRENFWLLSIFSSYFSRTSCHNMKIDTMNSSARSLTSEILRAAKSNGSQTTIYESKMHGNNDLRLTLTTDSESIFTKFSIHQFNKMPEPYPFITACIAILILNKNVFTLIIFHAVRWICSLLRLSLCKLKRKITFVLENEY